MALLSVIGSSDPRTQSIIRWWLKGMFCFYVIYIRYIGSYLLERNYVDSIQVIWMLHLMEKQMNLNMNVVDLMENDMNLDMNEEDLIKNLNFMENEMNLKKKW